MESSMPFPQIDPARLQGEALRRWYERSPADIEREREEIAAQRHREFFGRAVGGAPDQSVWSATARQGVQGSDPVVWSSAGENRWQGQRWPSANVSGDGAERQAQFRSGPQSALASPRSGSVSDCVSCHGRLTPPPFPFPWPNRPTLRDTPNAPPSKPRKEPPKQCDIQHDRDTEVCNGQPNPTARAMCHSSAMERLAWCIKTDGEVGWPQLFTHPDGPQR